MKLFSKKFANTIPYPAQDVSPVRPAAKIPEIVLHTHTTNLSPQRLPHRRGMVLGLRRLRRLQPRCLHAQT